MIHVQSQKIRRAFYVAGILTGMFMTAGTSADAANLMITIPSNYSSSIMGAITGSRVTTAVDGTAKTVRDDLNGDPGVFNINVNGQSKVFMRQYTVQVQVPLFLMRFWMQMETLIHLQLPVN